MSSAITTAQERDVAAVMEKLILQGDMSQLAPAERVIYYNHRCAQAGLDPTTKPFDYMKLNGKLVLYATKVASDQLGTLNEIDITIADQSVFEGVYVVVVTGKTKKGRVSSDVGAVPIAGLQGEAKANAIMKAVTKAKRRLTLSMTGLGLLDETEVESIPGAELIDAETGESRRNAPAPPPANPPRPAPQPAQQSAPAANEMATTGQRRAINELRQQLGWTPAEVTAALRERYQIAGSTAMTADQAVDFIDHLEALYAVAFPEPPAQAGIDGIPDADIRDIPQRDWTE